MMAASGGHAQPALEEAVTPTARGSASSPSSSSAKTLISLPDEVLLRILSLVSFKDVLECEAVCRRVGWVARGPSLWRDLYASAFPELYRDAAGARARGVPNAGSFTRSDTADELRTGWTDWKAAYRLAHNWKHGNFLSTQLRNDPGRLRDQAERAQVQGQVLVQVQPQAGSSTAESGHVAQAEPSGSTSRQTLADSSGSGHQHSSRASGSSSSGFRLQTLVRPSRVSTLLFTASRAASDATAAAPSSQLGINVFIATVSSRVAHQTNDENEDVVRCSDIADQDSLGMLYSKTMDELASKRNGVTITEIQVDSVSLAGAETEGGDVGQKGKGKARHIPLENSSSERIMVAYSTGHIVLFRVRLSRSTSRTAAGQQSPSRQLDWVEEAVYDPSGIHASGSTNGEKLIVASAFHSPLLVTCSTDFTLQIFGISTPSPLLSPAAGPSDLKKSELKLLLRMRSYTCHWPASLSLRELPLQQTPSATDRSLLKSSNSTPAPSSSTSFRQAKRSRLARAWHSAVAAASKAVLVGPSSDPKEKTRASHPSFFRLSIAYATPQYPASWTAGIQELILRLPAGAGGGVAATGWELLSNRHATAQKVFRPSPLDLHGRAMVTGADNESSGIDSVARTVGSQRAPILTTLTYDDPFLVVGSRSNTLDVFEVHGSARSVVQSSREGSSLERFDVQYSSTSSSPPLSSVSSTTPPALKLTHCRALLGHTAAVHAVALDTGRCVSGGADGRVMVWSLASPDSRGAKTAMGSALGKRKRRSSASSASCGGSAGDEEVEMDEGDEPVRLRTPVSSQSRRGMAVPFGHFGTSASSSSSFSTPGRASIRHLLTLPSPSPSSASSLPSPARGTPVSFPSEGNAESQRGGEDVDDHPQPAVVEWISTGPENIVSISSQLSHPRAGSRASAHEGLPSASVLRAGRDAHEAAAGAGADLRGEGDGRIQGRWREVVTVWNFAR
ncbi:unnamed protein product [Tilletia controversa]|nr:hypothetical protein CF335_g4744 [Tilletia laevis]CAD6909617.1 unnamed protein product [Tilletia caries]CAD6942838.1 unnamed protein product [Tilletia controversa]CAD7066270.1 unnamed protein product [Tilletia caries]